MKIRLGIWRRSGERYEKLTPPTWDEEEDKEKSFCSYKNVFSDRLHEYRLNQFSILRENPSIALWINIWWDWETLSRWFYEKYFEKRLTTMAYLFVEQMNKKMPKVSLEVFERCNHETFHIIFNFFYTFLLYRSFQQLHYKNFFFKYIHVYHSLNYFGVPSRTMEPKLYFEVIPMGFIGNPFTHSMEFNLYIEKRRILQRKLVFTKGRLWVRIFFSLIVDEFTKTVQDKAPWCMMVADNLV